MGRVCFSVRGTTAGSRIPQACLLLAGLFAAVALPSRAAAQETDTRGSSLELTGYAGVLTPLARLADQGDTLRAELSTKVAFSAELNWWAESGFGIGVMGTYTTPDLTVQRTAADSIGFPETLKLGATDYWALLGTVGWRPNLSGPASILLPYLMVGGGVRHLSVDSGKGFDVETGSKAIGVVGGGGQLYLTPRWHLKLDVRDFIYSFDAAPFAGSKLQNDLVVQVGVGLRLN